MKQLQSNFTTTEQSKRLLELGVPADSADCYISNEKIFVLHNCTFQENFNNDLDMARSHLINMPHYLPCWSVGRLIEIMKICNHPDDVDEVFCELAYSKKNLVELIVRLMEENKEITDFSKLVE